MGHETSRNTGESEADEGLWGGESVLKGYVESRPYTKKKVLPRHWVPHLWFPYLKQGVFYSEILDRLMKITVTERTCRLIDKHFGIDLYLLETPEIDLASGFCNNNNNNNNNNNLRLGNKLKRELLIALAKEEYFADDAERHSYIRNKYSRFKIPLEEAEWVGLELNEACRKQQDIEDAQHPEPLKYKFELDL
ncbi:unnamed protein product, partial [Anisakis simplex]|uniref:Large ribosomal subunit protein bL28m n=1 Tax=Anisakis simplex TaxID=6269 RepID=A0A0M3KIB5_ANISI